MKCLPLSVAVLHESVVQSFESQPDGKPDRRVLSPVKATSNTHPATP